MKKASDFVGRGIYFGGEFFVINKGASNRIANSLIAIEASVKAQDAKAKRDKEQEKKLLPRKCSFISGGDSF